MDFKSFGFNDKVLEAIESMGFKEATPVQEKTIPKILDNKDIIACAQTGTGKTAAFLLPIIEKITSGESSGINTLVVVPTRELAGQIDQQLLGMSYFAGVSSIAIYGGSKGSDFDNEKQALTSGADIIIATPGKLLTHLALGYVDMSNIKHVILDEADRMLDMGFFEDIMKIFSYLPKKRQTLLFSATMPKEIRKLANELQQNPEEVSIAISKAAEGILQAAYMVYPNQKDEMIQYLLEGKKEQSVLIFTSTKKTVTTLSGKLQKKKLSAKGISSDYEQSEREEVLREFKNKRVQVIVATDVLSRGIDIKGIDLVINYDVPNDAEDYVHRIGRTARADETGVALTFITENDQEKFGKIEKLLGETVKKLPLPPEVGEGPEYNPSKGGRGKRFSKRRGKR